MCVAVKSNGTVRLISIIHLPICAPSFLFVTKAFKPSLLKAMPVGSSNASCFISSPSSSIKPEAAGLTPASTSKVSSAFAVAIDSKRNIKKLLLTWISFSMKMTL